MNFVIYNIVKVVCGQPCPQANSRYPNEKRKPGTERDSERASSPFTDDVTLKLAGTTGDEAGLRIHSAIASWIHSCFDNIMTKFMINNRTDA